MLQALAPFHGGGRLCVPVGFHNPQDGERILKDANDEAAKAEAILRTFLGAHGVSVPKEVRLDLTSYLTDRGEKKFDFVPKDYIPDPTGLAQKRYPQNLSSLPNELPTLPLVCLTRRCHGAKGLSIG